MTLHGVKQQKLFGVGEVVCRAAMGSELSSFLINGLFNPLRPSGYFMYHQFNIHYSTFFHTACLCVLCGSENKQRLFPYTALTD